jgi:hypothetical protein
VQAYLLDSNGEDHLNPDQVLQSATLTLDNTIEISGTIEPNPLRLVFAIGTEVGLPETAAISVVPRSNSATAGFRLLLDESSFRASHELSGNRRNVPVRPRFSSALRIEEQFTLVPQSLESAFFCYPNPFAPGREVVNFSDPRAGSSAQLVIYTLTGEEVYSREYAAASTVPLTWSGVNNSGTFVLNGIYIAVLTVDGLGEARAKVAVVK